MLKRSRPTRLRIKVAPKSQFKITRPVIEPFPEEDGAFASAQRLGREYAKMVDGLRIPRQSGRGFRFDVGHHSDLIPATIPK
jgi:hypothetical protein